MKRVITFRKYVVALAGIAACGCLNVPSVAAQDRLPSQVSFQFGGVIPGDSTGDAVNGGNPISTETTRTGGFQANYSYQFNKWAGVGGGLGFANYSQNYSGDFGASSIESDLRKTQGTFMLHIPDGTARIHPYALVGVGAMRFNPTNNINNASGALSQTRPSFVYGGGADFDISKRIGIRAEYSGARFKVPDFQLAELTTNAETHIGEPSIGVYFKLPGFKKNK